MFFSVKVFQQFNINLCRVKGIKTENLTPQNIYGSFQNRGLNVSQTIKKLRFLPHQSATEEVVNGQLHLVLLIDLGHTFEETDRFTHTHTQFRVEFHLRILLLSSTIICLSQHHQINSFLLQ